MKASIAHNIRPSALILGKDSGKPWNKWDILLAKAYQRFLNELCPHCGLPKYICHNDDPRIQFKVVVDTCESLAASESRQAAQADSKQKRYGERVFGEPYLSEDAIKDGLELSDFRKPYLLENAKKQGLLPEDFPVPAP